MALAWTPSARLKQVALERAQPLAASLELTYRCNWRCVFCYNPRHHDRRGLSGAEWLAVLDDLRALGTPLRRAHRRRAAHPPDFLAIARGVRERAFALRILTNGALVTDALAAEIAALRPLAVELSLHGAPRETHDRATATPGSFDAMLRGARPPPRAGDVPVVLKTPLTRLNEAEMDGMRRIADGARRALAARPRAHAARRRRRRAARLPGLARGGGPDVPGRSRPSASSRTRSGSPGGTNCGLGRTTIAVDPEGNVFPCLQWRRAPLGNVRETPLRDDVGGLRGAAGRGRRGARRQRPHGRGRRRARVLPVLPRPRAPAHRRPASARREPPRAGRDRRARSASTRGEVPRRAASASRVGPGRGAPPRRA